MFYFLRVLAACAGSLEFLSPLVARVAVRTVPDITLDSAVNRVSLRLGVASSANKNCVIGRVRVTVGTLRRVMRDLEKTVIKGCARPPSGHMARLATSREACRYVIRIGCALVVGLMARVTIGRRGEKVAGNMTARAGHAQVLSRKRKDGLVMVEARWNPRGSAVAEFTGLRKSRGNMVRVRGPIEVFDVTGGTCCAQSHEYAGAVATGAGH